MCLCSAPPTTLPLPPNPPNPPRCFHFSGRGRWGYARSVAESRGSVIRRNRRSVPRYPTPRQMRLCSALTPRLQRLISVSSSPARPVYPKSLSCLPESTRLPACLPACLRTFLPACPPADLSASLILACLLTTWLVTVSLPLSPSLPPCSLSIYLSHVSDVHKEPPGLVHLHRLGHQSQGALHYRDPRPAHAHRGYLRGQVVDRNRRRWWWRWRWWW